MAGYPARGLVDNEKTNRMFRQLVQPIQGLIITLEANNSNLRTTRDFLLPKLVSGEISVEAANEVAPGIMEQTA